MNAFNIITDIEDEYKNKNAWGLASSIDLYNCKPSTIRDADQIKNFVILLCDLIEMKRFGDCIVVNFGEDEKVAGYSFVQLIETSCISGHLANLTNNVYLDVFSCKCYDPLKAAYFAKEYFEAEYFLIKHQFRL